MKAEEIFELTPEMLAEFECGLEPGEDPAEEEKQPSDDGGVRKAKKVNSSGTSSNSKLATYRHFAGNKYNTRTSKITKITIHHMSGKMTGRGCADYFAQTSRQVSSNYCIGYDGDIAVSIDECYRAWTSSSRANDMQAVTIEVSNNSGEPNWTISDKSMTALINLCTDICKRNGIKKMYYNGTTNASVTWHCMFANTDCPGAYIKKLTHYICGQVNSRLGSEILGDLDGDGKVTAKDACLALLIAAKRATPSNYQMRVGDLDGDGKIGAGDARKILRKAAKLG
ncbi:MAG: N-acetylmuramoyl-L-alanine amidase [Clostridia bacterium]|nr:N-acetylmuramoyl-L-alanine amidase [Clostridia bacterium]